MKIDSIRAVAEKYRGSMTGWLGVGFTDLQTGESFSLMGDDEFPAASTFKVFILAELFRQAQEGRFKMSDRRELTESFKSPGSGVLFNLQPGLTPTLQDYATLMMIISDNTATDVLFDLVGAGNIKEHVLAPLGLNKTKCDYPCKKLLSAYFGVDSLADFDETSVSLRGAPDFLCQTPQNDSTSPNDMMKILRLVYEKKLFTPWVCDEMLKIMKQCQTNTRIPKFLPAGVEVAHKTGTVDRVANDVGIVYTPKGDYILTLFYNGNAASEEEYNKNVNGLMSDSLLAEISRDIYAEYVK